MQVDLIKQVRSAIRDGDITGARSIARKMVLCDPEDPVAWLLLSLVVSEREKKIFCLEKVIQLTADQRIAKLARSWLSRVKKEQDKIAQIQRDVAQQSQKVLDHTQTPLGVEIPEADIFNQRVGIGSCHYLGMLQDPESHTLIPDKDNRCFRSSSSLSIDLSHQNRFCLNNDYIDCPIYVYGLDESTTQTFRNLETESNPIDRSSSKIFFLVLIGIIMLSILYVIYSSAF
jgi:hypothetical protein